MMSFVLTIEDIKIEYDLLNTPKNRLLVDNMQSKSAIYYMTKAGIQYDSNPVYSWHVVRNYKLNYESHPEIRDLLDSAIEYEGAEITPDIVLSLNDYLDDYLTFIKTSNDILTGDDSFDHFNKMKNLSVRKKESRKELAWVWKLNNLGFDFNSWIKPIINKITNLSKKSKSGWFYTSTNFTDKDTQK